MTVRMRRTTIAMTTNTLPLRHLPFDTFQVYGY